MRWFSRITNAFRNLFRKRQDEEDLDREVSAYLDLLTEEKTHSGMAPEAARRAARLELGGVEQVKEQIRDVRAGAWIETVLQDLRYAIRMLRHNLGFSILVIFTLALGIGVNTAIFSVVYGVLLRRFLTQHGGPSGGLASAGAGGQSADIPFSAKEIFDYREQSQSLDAVVEHHTHDIPAAGQRQCRTRADRGGFGEFLRRSRSKAAAWPYLSSQR